MAFLSRHATKVTVEGAASLEARFDPSPCCKRDGRAKKAAAATCINTQTGLWHCWSCNAVGNWFTLTRAFGEPLAWEDRFIDPAPPVDFSVYDRVRALQRRPVTAGHHPALLAYAIGRGFSPATLDAWRVTTKGPATLRWPMFARAPDGRWQIANARLRVCLQRDQAETKDWFEVRGGPVDLLIGYHLLGVRPPNYENPANDKPGSIDEGGGRGEVGEGVSGASPVPKRVLICEGQWDAMTAFELGIPNALSLPNGANNVAVASMLRYIPDDYEVWLALDMDAAGERAAEAFFAQLGPERVARLHLPHKDLNEWLQKEPGLTAAQVLATAKGLTPTLARAVAATEAAKLSRFVSIADEDESADADAIICQMPWERLTDLLGGGLRATQTTGILAPSGIGKTTVVNQIAVAAAKQEVIVGIISLESSRAAVRTKLRDQVRGWTNYTGDTFKAVCGRLLLSELEGSDVKWEDCLEELETMIQQGAKLIVWDNPDYQMPRRAANPSAIKLEAYARFQQLCKKHGVHGIVVWQPNKIDRDKVINSGDQKGMAQALQDADNYLNLNRIGNMRRIEVEKTRAEGALDGGRYCWIKYDPATRCLSQVDHQANLSPVDAGQPEVGAGRPELL